MSPQKKRTDIYNLKAIADRVDFENKAQKLATLFKGINYYTKNEDIDAIIAVIQSEAKDMVKYLKSLKHQHLKH